MSKERKLLAIMFLGVICIFLAGCGHTQTDGSVSVDNQEVEACDEILDADFGSGKIQIGKKVVQFPVKVEVLTDLTNAEYFSIGYDPDISSNEFLLSSNDADVIAGLYFPEAECDATYYSCVPQNEGCKAGELIVSELQDIVSPNIILPKGVRVGMTIDEIETLTGLSVGEPWYDTEDTLCYSVKFPITEDEAVENCKLYHTITFSNVGVPTSYYGDLKIEVDRATGEIVNIQIAYAYGQ